MTLTLQSARAAIAAAEAEAVRLNTTMAIAVVDSGANLVAFARMDGAWIGAIDIAIDKAFTARALDKATEDLAAFTQSGQRVFGLNTTNGGRIVIFGGGIPIQRDGQVIGGIGVSGSTADKDVLVARAGLTALDSFSGPDRP